MEEDKLAIFGGIPVRNKKIFYGHQYIDNDDIEAVTEVLKSDFLTCGSKVPLLEKKLCELTGAKYAVAVSSGTAALHAACYAAGVEKQDEVITTPITFAASANCALYVDAVPVFADIRQDTYNINTDEIERKISARTKAVISVDFTGQAAELNQIRDICNKNKIIFIEDAAHAIGTRYQDKMVGSIADLTTFSFHPVKTITGGEGGAILTNNEEFYKKLLLFRSHGITRNPLHMEHTYEGEWYYEQIELGYNLRMTDIQAALICSQLNKLNLFKKRRNYIVNKYNEAFQKMPEIVVQREIPESDTVRHLYIIQLNLERLNSSRKDIFDALSMENVCCNVHYIPVYYFPFYEKLGYKRGLCPVAEFLYERILTLPLYFGMTDEDIQSVITAVKKVINYYKR